MGTKDLDSCIGYDSCLAYKPKSQTRVERIRTMSDEEMAAHFAHLFAKWRKIEAVTESTYTDPKEFGVLESIYNAWLLEHFRKPVKDGDNDGV